MSTQTDTPETFTADHFIVGGRKVDANGQDVKSADPKVDSGTQTQAPAVDRRNVADLTKALTDKGVVIPDGSKRDDLVKLAADNGV